MQSDPFAPTHWSVIVAAGKSQVDPDAAKAALAQLCETYWAPLYTFVRSRGYSLHDAQDLTQGFFAYLIEHKTYARADRTKGRFRSFLLVSLKNFLADARDREQALKRGGRKDFLPLNEEQVGEAESLFQTGFAPKRSTLSENSGKSATEDNVLVMPVPGGLTGFAPLRWHILFRDIVSYLKLPSRENGDCLPKEVYLQQSGISTKQASV